MLFQDAVMNRKFRMDSTYLRSFLEQSKSLYCHAWFLDYILGPICSMIFLKSSLPLPGTTSQIYEEIISAGSNCPHSQSPLFAVNMTSLAIASSSNPCGTLPWTASLFIRLFQHQFSFFSEEDHFHTTALVLIFTQRGKQAEQVP